MTHVYDISGKYLYYKMPRGEPKDNAQKTRIDKYKRDKFLTPNQYKSLSWSHLDQIGKYNKDNQKKPKPGGDNSKTHAQWQATKKGKSNEKYKK